MHSLPDYLASHPKKHLIFDFDETLFTLDLPWGTYREVMKRRLWELDPTLPDDPSITAFENTAVRELGEAAARVRWGYSLEFEREYLQGVLEHHELTDFLRYHADTYHYYLWTSNMRATVEPILAEAGLLKLFTSLITKGSVMLTKPEPEGFEKIFKPDQHQREEFLMIGNSSLDRAAAVAAGIDFFLVKH
jgi:phosphoglycolate phosphatase-like HAD superfamily hydrolase